jgi:hypothetical protein
METANHPIMTYISHFHMADYIAFAWLILIFFLFIFLAILLAKKRPFVSIGVVLLDFMLLFSTPFVMKHYLDAALRPQIAELTTVKQLTYSDTLILQGTLTNISLQNFSWCTVHLAMVPKESEGLAHFLNTLNPSHQTSIFIEEPPQSGASVTFEKVVENFRLDESLKVIPKAECY